MNITKLTKNLFNAYKNEIWIESERKDGKPIRAAVALPFVWIGMAVMIGKEFIEEFEQDAE